MSYCQASIRILRYVKGTIRHEILFPYGVLVAAEMICSSDYDWCGDKVDRRSTT